MAVISVERIQAALEPWVHLASSYDDPDRMETTLRFGLVSMLTWCTALTDDQRAAVLDTIDRGAPPEAARDLIYMMNRANIRASEVVAPRRLDFHDFMAVVSSWDDERKGKAVKT